MNEGIIAARYAKALFVFARDKNIVEQVRGDMLNILDLYQNVPEFSSLLNTPVIRPSKKKEIIFEVFSKQFGTITLNFFELLLKNGREKFLIPIARRFERQYKEFENIKTAVLTSIIPLPESAKKKMIKLVEDAFHCKVDMHEKQDNRILGGFVLRVENEQFDGSLATRLKVIKEGLMNFVVDDE